MIKATIPTLGLALALALGGCKKDEKQEQEPAAPPPAPSPVQATQAMAEPEPAVDEIPTEEDFEEEAATTITPENLEEELDKLEAEIDEE